jgi:threonine synthase
MILPEPLENMTTEVGWSWNPRARLRCIDCGSEQPLGPAFNGCERCSDGEERAPLEVIYEESDPQQGSRLRSLLRWLSVDRQPIAPTWRVSLGRTPTPLVPVDSLGPTVLVKNETLNPTWSHKDRLHEVNVGVAKMLESVGVVASTTGNHGAAAAAHAAAAGLPAVIFCHPEASSMTLRMISAYGGVVVQLSSEDQRTALASMVDEGWFPATSMDPIISGRSNPYGSEGYKLIAYEIVAALGRMPEAVIIPTASGDTVYGIAKGFAEVAAATGSAPTRIVAAQPEAANPLQLSLRDHRMVRVPNARSFALSVSEEMTGRQAMVALQRWNGHVVSVPEVSIRDSVRKFARAGLLVEPASAVSYAGYQRTLERGLVGAGDTTVLLATSSGVKWPRELGEIFPVAPVTDSHTLKTTLEKLLRTDQRRKSRQEM